jgi:hypothetical protein
MSPKRRKHKRIQLGQFLRLELNRLDILQRFLLRLSRQSFNTWINGYPQVRVNSWCIEHPTNKLLRVQNRIQLTVRWLPLLKTFESNPVNKRKKDDSFKLQASKWLRMCLSFTTCKGCNEEGRPCQGRLSSFGKIPSLVRRVLWVALHQRRT